MKLLLLLFVLMFSCYESNASLEVFNDDELLALLNSEKFVIVLFTKKDCAQCEKYESALLNIREDLVDQLNAYVVACVNSMLAKLYNPAKEPSIVFFRHGVPLLYDGGGYFDTLLKDVPPHTCPCVFLMVYNVEGNDVWQTVSGGSRGGGQANNNTDRCLTRIAVENELLSKSDFFNKKRPGRVFNNTNRWIYTRFIVPHSGAVNEELILHTITENQEPAVRELTDDTFEHLTQASSGATTGDWFVMFYATNCVDCQRLQARWEAVGATLKTRMNTARVNRQTTGRVTSRRFGVVEIPTFLLFRQGNMYRYNIPKYDVASFVTFATDWFKNARSEKVPVPKTPFDDLTLQIAEYIKENPWMWKIGSIAICIGVIASVIFRLNTRELEKKKSVKKDKSDKVKKAK